MCSHILPMKRLLHTSWTPYQGGDTGGSTGKPIGSEEARKTVESAGHGTKYVDPMKFTKFEPTYLDKHFLVWSGHYKTRADVPKTVSKEVLERTRSLSRIRINLGFMVVGLAAAALYVYLGKQSFKKGDTVESRNREWHRQVKEEHERSQAAPIKES